MEPRVDWEKFARSDRISSELQLTLPQSIALPNPDPVCSLAEQLPYQRFEVFGHQESHAP